MHPEILGLVARDHVRSLIEDADAARLAAAATRGPASGLRRRLGLRLIAFGSRLAPEPTHNVFHIHGRRV